MSGRGWHCRDLPCRGCPPARSAQAAPAQAPALDAAQAMAGGEVMRTTGAKPKRHQRRYTAPERLGYMMLAIETSSEQVEAKYHVPSRTIRQWFDDVGGIAECRRWLETQALASYLQSRRAVFDAVTARVSEGDFAEVMETYRKMVAPAESHGVNINLNQQQGQVQAHGDLSAAESAYLAALAGQSSLPPGQALTRPALPISGNGVDGSQPAEDYPEGEADRHLDGDNG